MNQELCNKYRSHIIVYDDNKQPIDAAMVNCSECPNRFICDGGNVIICKIEIPDEVSEVG